MAPHHTLVKFQKKVENHIISKKNRYFFNLILDVNIRAVDVNNRKPFGLRSDYVQITFNYVQLRSRYAILT